MSSTGIYTAAISIGIMTAVSDGAVIADIFSAGLERLASPATLLLGAMAGLAVMTFRPTRG